MKTTQYLDAIKARYNLPSDYALQKVLPVGKQAISKYRKGHCHFDDKVAKVVAELLDLDPAKVIADIHAERTDDKEMKAIWKRIAATFGRAACLILLVFSSVALVSPTPAQAAATSLQYILCKISKILEKILKRLLSLRKSTLYRVIIQKLFVIHAETRPI